VLWCAVLAVVCCGVVWCDVVWCGVVWHTCYLEVIRCWLVMQSRGQPDSCWPLKWLLLLLLSLLVLVLCCCRSRFVGNIVRASRRALLLTGTPLLSRPIEAWPQVRGGGVRGKGE